MSANISDHYPENKVERYDLLCKQLTALVEGEKEPIPNLAKAAPFVWMMSINSRDISLATVHPIRKSSSPFAPEIKSLESLISTARCCPGLTASIRTGWKSSCGYWNVLVNGEK